MLIWDNLNTHVSAAMAETIAARPWLRAYRLQPYAHELNPVEPVWSHLKRFLADLTKHTLAELTALVKSRLKRMQYRPGLLAGFLASTGLDFAPFCNSGPYESLDRKRTLGAKVWLARDARQQDPCQATTEGLQDPVLRTFRIVGESTSRYRQRPAGRSTRLE